MAAFASGRGGRRHRAKVPRSISSSLAIRRRNNLPRVLLNRSNNRHLEEFAMSGLQQPQQSGTLVRFAGVVNFCQRRLWRDVLNIGPLH